VLSDTALVAGIRRNDAIAVQAFLSRFEKLAYSYARRLPKRHSEALREYVLEMLEHARRQLADGKWDDSKGALTGFVRRVLKNKALDILKKIHALPPGDSLDDLMNAGFEPQVTTADPERLLHSAAIADGIRNCLDEMPKKYGDVVKLHLIGHKYAVIMTIREETEPTIRSRISRGMGFLRECLRVKGLTP
jgi:DNA-directed RNA polymerase specialized sigma24 family protein